MMRTVLLLLSKTSYRASDFLSAAQKLKIDVVVGSDQENLLAPLNEAGFIALDFHDRPGAVKAIVDYASMRPLSAILPVDEISGPIAAQASRILGLVQNPLEAVNVTANKYRFRQFLRRENISDMAFELIDRTGDIAPMGRRLSFPLVLKPLTLSGSRGVIRVNNDNEFGAAISRIGRILDNPEIVSDAQTSGYILAEAYIEGDEIALEGLVENGQLNVLAVFDKPDPLEGPFFEETLYVTPSRQPEDRLEMAIARTQQAVSALGITTGPVHGEIRLNRDGAHLIELATRSIGGLCSRVLELGAGQSLEEIILCQVIGKSNTGANRMARPAGVMMIPIPAMGILRSVSGLESARKINEITAVTISIPLGGDVIPLPEGNRYLGFIFAKADSPDDVERALRQAHACLHFDIDQTSS